MSNRELEDWLDAYLEYTESSEPPTSYHIWCGLTVIAGALQRKVYLQQGLERTIYPNLYVILVGPSGRTRKGVALGIAKDMLSKVGTVSVAPEASSGRESLVRAMIRSKNQFTDKTDGKVKEHCSLTAFSEELSVFLGQGDIKLLANLTDWYDSKDVWTYETIGRGIDRVHGICFNMAGGTAPEWIQSMLPREAVGGGWTARVIFVVEEWKKWVKPGRALTAREQELLEKLETDLSRIHLLSGQFDFTGPAYDAWSAWYQEEDRKMSTGKYMPVQDGRFASYCERRQTHIRKIMMLLCASRTDSMKIEVQDFNRALSMMLHVEKKMGKTFGGLGAAKNSDATEQLLRYIEVMGITTRRAILQKFIHDIDAQKLQEIEPTLTGLGRVKITLLPKSGDKTYEWIAE